jgi:hypothetical protein
MVFFFINIWLVGIYCTHLTLFMKHRWHLIFIHIEHTIRIYYAESSIGLYLGFTIAIESLCIVLRRNSRLALYCSLFASFCSGFMLRAFWRLRIACLCLGVIFAYLALSLARLDSICFVVNSSLFSSKATFSPFSPKNGGLQSDSLMIT